MKATAVGRVTELMSECGALLKGHFRLASGLHSDEYWQCAKVAEHPEVSEEIGRMLADLFRGEAVDVVASPAIGGIVIGYEAARALGVRAIWAERVEGTMMLRRGFAVGPGERVLIIEDVVTTGGSSAKAIQAVRDAGGEVTRVLAVVDREQGGKENLRKIGCRLESIFSIELGSSLIRITGNIIGKPMRAAHVPMKE